MWTLIGPQGSWCLGSSRGPNNITLSPPQLQRVEVSLGAEEPHLPIQVLALSHRIFAHISTSLLERLLTSSGNCPGSILTCTSSSPCLVPGSLAPPHQPGLAPSPYILPGTAQLSVTLD